MTKDLVNNEKKELIENTNSFQKSIEQLLLRDDIDFERMDRYLDMQERIMNKNAETEFNKALANMQPKLPIIKRSTQSFNTKYAAYEDIMRPYLPILSKYGFSLYFGIKEIENGINVIGSLAHKEGHSRTESLCLPLDKSGQKNSIQAIGSTISYGKRYLAGMLLNVVTERDDDDGQAGGTPFVDEEMIANIKALMTEVKVDERRFLKFINVKTIETIRGCDYKKAIAALEIKRK